MRIIIDTINAAFRWTGEVLFKPFHFKKWLVLGFAAWLAGSLTGGSFRVNVPSSSDFKSKRPHATAVKGNPATNNTGEAIAASSAEKNPFTRSNLAKAKTRFKQALHKPLVRNIIIGITLAFILLLAVLTWLYSRFVFVFLDNVVRNAADIKAPFKEYRVPGNSLFWFNFILCTVSLALWLGVCVIMVIALWPVIMAFKPSFHWGFMLLRAMVPYLVGMLFLTLAALIVNVAVWDFTVPVMYKEKAGILASWRKARAVIEANNGKFFAYFFAKIGVVLCIELLMGFVYLALVVGAIFPWGGVMLVLVVIYKLLPAMLHPAFVILAVICAIPVWIGVMYVFMCFRLPAAVFKRAWSVLYLGRMAAEYELLPVPGPKEA